jgi:hypothetical protein
VPVNACCSHTKDKSCSNYKEHKDKDCCKTTSKFHRITVPVELPVKPQVKEITSIDKVSYTELTRITDNDEDHKQIIYSYYDSGPPLDGPSILILYQQLKLSPPSHIL